MPCRQIRRANWHGGCSGYQRLISAEHSGIPIVPPLVASLPFVYLNAQSIIRLEAAPIRRLRHHGHNHCIGSVRGGGHRVRFCPCRNRAGCRQQSLLYWAPKSNKIFFWSSRAGPHLATNRLPNQVWRPHHQRTRRCSKQHWPSFHARSISCHRLGYSNGHKVS
jgi:hypothetical protein